MVNTGDAVIQLLIENIRFRVLSGMTEALVTRREKINHLFIDYFLSKISAKNREHGLIG